MSTATKRSNAIRQLALGAMLTAIVVVLQLLGSFIRFGTFSVSLVLVPIVLGAALCGPWIGAWLGFVFGAVVLLSGDAAPFLAVSAHGTILTVLLKGALCGLCAGLVYRWLSKVNSFLAVLAAAIICPVVNTGVFLLGCIAFFMPTITEWAGGTPVWSFILVGFIGFNFLFELGFNILLAGIIERIINAIKGNVTKDRINKRKVGLCLFFSLITLGLYDIYWAYLLIKNSRIIKKDYSNCAGETICFLFLPFYSLYWWITKGKVLNEQFAEKGYTAVGNKYIYLVLGLTGLNIVSMAIMQNDFNMLPEESSK